LLLVIGSVAAFFVDPQWAVKQATHYLGELLPRGPLAIDRIVAQTLTTARGGGLFSILPLIWTGALVFGTVTQALNIIFDAGDEFHFWKHLRVRFAMLLVLGGMFLVALASQIVLQVLRWTFGILPFGQETLFQLVVTALPPAFVLAAFFSAYRFVPGRRPHWRAGLAGASLATLLFATGKPIFLGYLHWLGRYNVIYGSLAGIIVVVLWAWIVAMIGLFGAQVAAHTQAVFIEGRPIEEVERRHLRHTSNDRLA
ncbi:MAG: YihY/virulence factor BrkB family protein, partial [Chthoniobacteraceae bacterium]